MLCFFCISIFCVKMQNAYHICLNHLQMISFICCKSCQIQKRNTQVSDDVHILISSQPFGIHVCLISQWSQILPYILIYFRPAFMQEEIAGKLQAFVPLGNIMGFAPLNFKAFSCICNVVELSICHMNMMCQIAEVYLY